MVQLKESPAPVSGGLYIISIPHGTIKSGYEGRWRVTYREFQYLMVQLKDTGDCVAKRWPTFQYLMVQLKEMAKLNSILMEINFNTSWYN